MDIGIGSNSIYNVAADLVGNNKKTDALENSLKKKDVTDEELMKACKSFETYFLEQVFKGMEKTVPREEEKSPYLEQFGDKLYEEYAQKATDNRSLGLAQMLYDSMKRNQSTVE
jgi:peptidoglycan hydrolase FlgJ